MYVKKLGTVLLVGLLCVACNPNDRLLNQVPEEELEPQSETDLGSDLDADTDVDVCRDIAVQKPSVVLKLKCSLSPFKIPLN